MTQPVTEHRIRLRGPWKYRWLSNHQTENSRWASMRHPDEWRTVVAGKSGHMELSRGFHAPSNLESPERLFIVLTGVSGTGEVTLNDQSLGEFDRSSNHHEFACPLPIPFNNTLLVRIRFDAESSMSDATGLYDTVELLIRAAT